MSDTPPAPRTFWQRPLAQLTLCRFREFFREPAAIFWVYGFPMILSLILGLAFESRPIERIKVDIATDSGSIDTIKGSLETDPRIVVELTTLQAAKERLRTNKTGIVVIPTPASPGWEYILDPNRPECVLAKAACEGALLRAANPTIARPEEKILTEPGGRYIDFLFPGLIGINLMGGGLFGVGFMIVDMRVRKLLKRFMATPMNRRDFLLSLMLSRLLFTVCEMTVLLLFARFAFNVTIHGNVLVLIILILLGAATFGGVGLLIACRANTIETASGLMNAVMFPMYLLGGVFFPSDQFPSWTQPILNLLPLTALNQGLRAIINDGAGWSALPAPAVILTAWGVLCFTLALRWFRWR